MLKKIFFILIVVTIILGALHLLQPKSDYVCQNCNVIIISMTNLGFGHMSSNGYFRPTTPNLDKLATEGLNFTNAFSHASWTLPSASSIFTSLYPFAHGVMNRYDGSKLSKDTPTLVDILNKNSYKTAAFTGGTDYSPRYGLTDRFLHNEDCKKREVKKGYLPPIYYGEFGCAITKALNWLKNNSNQKFFLFLQGYDAHCPFDKHTLNIYDKDYKGDIDFTSCIWTFDKAEPVVKKGKTYYPVYVSKELKRDKLALIDQTDINHLIALYDEQVTATDQRLGEFLDEIKKMGLSKNTIIIFTSEHGDIFGKYGRFMRGGPLRGTFYDDVLHIPLIIKNPKLKGVKLEGLAQHIDIMPTLLDILGIKANLKIQGKNLTSLLYGKQVNDYVFAGSEFNPGTDNIYYTKKNRIESLRNKEWKLIREFTLDDSSSSATLELYDIKNDKEELNNLANERKDILNNLEEKLNAWSEKMRQK